MNIEAQYSEIVAKLNGIPFQETHFIEVSDQVGVFINKGVVRVNGVELKLNAGDLTTRVVARAIVEHLASRLRK